MKTHVYSGRDAHHHYFPVSLDISNASRRLLLFLIPSLSLEADYGSRTCSFRCLAYSKYDITGLHLIIMGSLADDSPFNAVITVADWIDRARESYWSLVLPFVVLLLHGAYRQLDRTLFLLCATWNLRSLLLPICHNLTRSKYTLGTTVLAFAIWTGYYGLGIILRDVSQHQDDPTGIYLIPSRVTHRRKGPKKHSFSYSYLTVGIPVGYRGGVDGMISVDEPDIPIAWSSGIWRMNNWFRVDARDYLERSNHELGLRGKLDNYLESQV